MFLPLQYLRRFRLPLRLVLLRLLSQLQLYLQFHRHLRTDHRDHPVVHRLRHLFPVAAALAMHTALPIQPR